MDTIAWQTVARVLHRVQSDLDEPWDLERMAAVAGYERHHLAHLFSDVVGEPPARYVRRLRLERAASELLMGAPVAQAAERAVYGSPEAFSRAFKRQFGVAPAAFPRHVREQEAPIGATPAPHASEAGAWPDGLGTRPVIEPVGPLAGWTVLLPSFAPEQVGYGMAQLMTLCPPTGPWQLGGIAQPWGWLTEDAPREFRCVRLRERDDRPPPPPLVPWGWPRDWFAVFAYEGPLDGIDPACRWMAQVWPEAVGLRLGYGPLFSLLEALGDPLSARAKLHLPVRPLAAPTTA